MFLFNLFIILSITKKIKKYKHTHKNTFFFIWSKVVFCVLFFFVFFVLYVFFSVIIRVIVFL
ncbi:hypothetical protein BEC68_28185 [Escherichia coli]|nr:hypothetical protein [Escherichia coli]OJR08601.1 hypothetical protein BK375_27710 [Escherichia coli]